MCTLKVLVWVGCCAVDVGEINFHTYACSHDSFNERKRSVINSVLSVQPLYNKEENVSLLHSVDNSKETVTQSFSCFISNINADDQHKMSQKQQIRDHLKGHGVDHSTAHSVSEDVIEAFSTMDPEDITHAVIGEVLRAGGVPDNVARKAASGIAALFN